MEIFFFGWFILACIVGFIANERGRSPFGWFLLSFFLSPLIGLLGVLLSKDLIAARAERDAEERRHQEQLAAIAASADKRRADARAVKHCPQCAEEILAEAVKCRFCGADVRSAA